MKKFQSEAPHFCVTCAEDNVFKSPTHAFKSNIYGFQKYNTKPTHTKAVQDIRRPYLTNIYEKNLPKPPRRQVRYNPNLLESVKGDKNETCSSRRCSQFASSSRRTELRGTDNGDNSTTDYTTPTSSTNEHLDEVELKDTDRVRVKSQEIFANRRSEGHSESHSTLPIFTCNRDKFNFREAIKSMRNKWREQSYPFQMQTKSLRPQATHLATQTEFAKPTRKPSPISIKIDTNSKEFETSRSSLREHQRSFSLSRRNSINCQKEYLTGNIQSRYPSLLPSSIETANKPINHLFNTAAKNRRIKESRTRFGSDYIPKKIRSSISPTNLSQEQRNMVDQQNGNWWSENQTMNARPHHRSALALQSSEAGVSVNFQLSQAFRCQRDSRKTEHNVPTPSAAIRVGPSFKRLQTRFGSSPPLQQRFPSDNALEQTCRREDTQNGFQIPSIKTGTIRIQVRSRSAQASPMHSPETILNDTESEHIITSQSRTKNGFSNKNLTEMCVKETEMKSEKVREIEVLGEEIMSTVNGMREEYDISEWNRSTREPLISGHQSRTVERTNEYHDNNIEYPKRSISATLEKNTSNVLSNGKLLDEPRSGIIPGSHNSFRLGSTGPPNIRQNNFYEYNSFQKPTHPLSRKVELLNNLPQDYQKLRESFLDQRRELQRLRAELAEKDRQVAELVQEIKLYEPWR